MKEEREESEERKEREFIKDCIRRFNEAEVYDFRSGDKEIIASVICDKDKYGKDREMRVDINGLNEDEFVVGNLYLREFVKKYKLIWGSTVMYIDDNPMYSVDVYLFAKLSAVLRVCKRYEKEKGLSNESCNPNPFEKDGKVNCL
jgi:hypothetical protein